MWGITDWSATTQPLPGQYTSANIANLAAGATERRLVNLVKRAIKSAESNAITTIVEFFDLAPEESSHGKKIELFSPSVAKVHPYLKGLRKELEGNYRIYIFYDSRGRALYAGKAEKRVLWDEIKNAFNRDRDVQKIKRVTHPQRRTAFRTSEEKRRQIVSESVPLHELASYLSAYATPKELIGPPTRLLDWTLSPLVAVYFAVTAPRPDVGHPSDCAVYAFRGEDYWYDDEVKKPFARRKDFRIVDAAHYPTRIAAQKGFFTLRAQPNKPFRTRTLRKFVIPGNLCDEFQEKLDFLGLNHATLFPDLDGLGHYWGWCYRTNR